MPSSHTIVLVQPTRLLTSRTFSDYETVSQAMEGIVHMYEAHLKDVYPNRRNITYDISELFQYIDKLADLSCLVFTPNINAYAPFNKDWIKDKIVTMLKRQAQQ
eukprot:Opistho-2@49765